MLATLKELLNILLPPTRGAASAGNDEHRLRLATAVLLMEVMRADTTFQAGEREAVHACSKR